MSSQTIISEIENKLKQRCQIIKESKNDKLVNAFLTLEKYYFKEDVQLEEITEVKKIFVNNFKKFSNSMVDLLTALDKVYIIILIFSLLKRLKAVLKNQKK